MTRQNSPGRPPDKKKLPPVFEEPAATGKLKATFSFCEKELSYFREQLIGNTLSIIDSPLDDKSCQTFNNALNLTGSIDQAARAVDQAGNDADYQAAFDSFLASVAATIAPATLRAAMRRQFGPRFGETEVSYDW